MAIGTLRLEQYEPVVAQNGGLYTELPITTTSNMIVTGNLTVSGTTNIGTVALVDLTTTGNTTLGNAVTGLLTGQSNVDGALQQLDTAWSKGAA